MASKSLGTLTIDLIMETGGFIQGMDRAAREARSAQKDFIKLKQEISGHFSTIFNGIATGAGVAFTAVSFAIGAAVKSAIEYGDKIDEISSRTKVSVASLQELDFAAVMNGLTVEDLNVDKLTKAMSAAQEEGSKFAKLFSDMGVKFQEANGKLLPTKQVLMDIAQYFKDIDDPVGEAALSMEIFGKSGSTLLEFLNRGKDGIQQLIDKARDLGIVMSDDAVNASATFNDQMAILGMQLRATGGAIAEKLLPMVIQLSEDFADWMKTGDAANTILDTIDSTINVVTGTLAVFRGAWAALTGVIAQTINMLSGLVTMVVRAQGAVINFLGAVGRMDFKGMWSSISGGVKSQIENFNTTLKVGKDIWVEHGKAAITAGRQAYAAMKGNTAAAKEQKKAMDALSASGTKSGPAARLDPGGGGGGKKGGGGGKPKKEGPSDAEKELERLNDKYDSLIDSYKERIALMGKETEVAKQAYATQEGALKKLTSTQKENLLARARAVDLATQEQAIAKRLEGYKEKIALLGKEGEAAKVMWEITNGGLKDYTEAKKQELLLGAQELDQAEALQKIKDKERKKIESDIEFAKDYVTEIGHQTELLGKTADEQERLNLLRDLGTQGNTAYGQSALAALDQFQGARLQMERIVSLSDTFRESMGEAFSSMIDGSKSFKDAMKDALTQINAQIMKMVMDQLITKLFGGMGTAGIGGMAGKSGAGGWLTTLFTGLAGGGRATGGGVYGGSMYRVNERGPEMLSVNGKDFLMMGSGSGNVTPNHMLKGGNGFSQSNNFIIQGKMDRRTEMQIAGDVGRKATQAQRRNS